MSDKERMNMFVEQSQALLKLKDENYVLRSRIKKITEDNNELIIHRYTLLNENESLKKIINKLNGVKG